VNATASVTTGLYIAFGELPGGGFAEGNVLRPAIVVDPGPSLRVAHAADAAVQADAAH
jgi:hypothetical protein